MNNTGHYPTSIPGNNLVDLVIPPLALDPRGLTYMKPRYPCRGDPHTISILAWWLFMRRQHPLLQGRVVRRYRATTTTTTRAFSCVLSMSMVRIGESQGDTLARGTRHLSFSLTVLASLSITRRSTHARLYSLMWLPIVTLYVHAPHASVLYFVNNPCKSRPSYLRSTGTSLHVNRQFSNPHRQGFRMHICTQTCQCAPIPVGQTGIPPLHHRNHRPLIR